MGEKEKAEATADKALAATADEGDRHLVAAFNLQERGLFQWAKREYRQVLELEDVGSLLDLRARRLFSEMLHDIEEEEEAGKVLQTVVKVMDADPKILQIVQQRLGMQPGSLRSRMHFFLALHARENDKHEESQKQLLLGIQEDPTDADVLIAMYRAVEPDEEFKAETMKRIDAATGKFRGQVDEFKKQSEEAPSEQIREYAKRSLATVYNQYAWLVGNTTGDYQEALRYSQRSLELRPEAAGFMDTLGRCYYAVGDLENAIKHQSRAVELEPHSGAITRQLEFFKKELAAKSAEAAKNENP